MHFRTIFFCLFGLATTCEAQVLKLDKTNIYSAATVPSVLITKETNAIMREYNEVFVKQSLDKLSTHVHFVATILKKEGEEHAQCVAMYDKLTKVSGLKGKLYNGAGDVVKKLKSDDIRDIALNSDGTFVDDNRAKVGTFSYGQFPYTVEFDYDIEHTGGTLGTDRWFVQSSEDLAIENAAYEIRVPAGEPLKYKAYNIENAKPEMFKQTEKGQLYDIYRWNMSNQKPRKSASYTNASEALSPGIVVTTENFKYAGHDGSLSSWKEFGKFIYKLNEGRDQLPDAFKIELKTLVKDCPTPLSKVEKIYDYLQKNTRYVGIQLGVGGYQPFLASDVCLKKYGDCKGLSNFMFSMLKEVGIPSIYTLAWAGDSKPFPIDENFVSNSFNHALLCVPLEKDTVWLECTSQKAAAGYCGSFTGDRNVLLITPEGGKVVHTPQYKEKENLENRKALLKLDAEGNVVTEVETQYVGLKQELANELATHNNDKDVKDYYYRRLQLPNFEIKNIKFTIDKNRLPAVTEKMSLTINRYASKSGKRLFIQPNIFNKYTFSMPDTTTKSTRSASVVASEMAFTENDTLEWDLPEGFSLEHTPEPVKIKSRFGEYNAVIKTDGKKLVYTRQLIVNNETHPSQTLMELIDFYKNVEKSDKSKVVLVNKAF
jgi:Domain of Unknown Function with PDB structure (DUF3857)/Transglutaminase-like superfamily